MRILKKGLILDGIASTEDRDSDNESLILKGADISMLENGKGRLNDNHSSGFFNSLGRVIFAKKIFTEEDASTPREKMYWEMKHRPFLYIQGELFDNHPNAQAASAIISHLHDKQCPLSVKASVEGDVVKISENGELLETKIHSIALTFVPANSETILQPMQLQKNSIKTNWENLCKNIQPKQKVTNFIRKNNNLKDEVNNLLLEIDKLLKNKKKMLKCKSCGKIQQILNEQYTCCKCYKPFDFESLSKIINEEN
jgi:hypothetical protein